MYHECTWCNASAESIHRVRGPCLLGCLGAKMMMRYEQLFPVLGGLCLKAEEHDVEFVEWVCTPHKSELMENRVIQRKIKKKTRKPFELAKYSYFLVPQYAADQANTGSSKNGRLQGQQA